MEWILRARGEVAAVAVRPRLELAEDEQANLLTATLRSLLKHPSYRCVWSTCVSECIVSAAF